MEILNPSWPALAPVFHYHVSRFEVIGGSDPEGFLYLEKALATLSTIGICTEKLHPHHFDAPGTAASPSDDARADARRRALGWNGLLPRYQQVSGLSRVLWIQEQLRLDHPVVTGIQLPTTYRKNFLNPAFEWLDPAEFPRSAVGHCVLVTGYEDPRGAFHVQDSHGDREFQQGRWWLGYRVVDSSLFLGGYSLA